MGDESALEARLERAHTVIGDLLRSLGEIELLPERQQAAAREAIAFREHHVIERGVSRLVERELSQVSRALDGAFLDTSTDWKPIEEAARTRGVPNDLPEDIKRQVIRDGWAPPIRRLLERAAELRSEVERLTADLVQSEERRQRAEKAALAAEQHLHAIRHAAGLSPGEWGDIAATVIERLRGCDERLVRLEALCHQLEDNGVTTTATTWIGNLEGGITKLIDQRDGACARREADETARIKADANAVFEAQRTDLASAIGVGGSSGATWDWNALVRRCSDLRREHVEMTAAVERIGAAHDRGVAMWREITQSATNLPPDRAELMSWLLTKLDDDQREHASYVANLQHAHANEVASLKDRHESEHHDLVAVWAAMPPGDVRVPIAQRVAQLVNEHGEMVAEMMKAADPEDIADAAASLADQRPVPAPELEAVEFIDVVFDGAPSQTSFMEVEDHRGHNIKVGEWLDRGDGTWALRIPMQPPAEVGKVMAAAGALSALTAVVATSGMNWQRSPCLAWVYGVLVGHDRDVLEDLQLVFNWPDGTVDEIDRHRRALLAARGA